MFHNFWVHESERSSKGLRFTNTRKDGGYEPHTLLRFSVLHFGGKCSPNRILEWAKGDQHDLMNPYHWSHMQLNLPCSVGIGPLLPRVLVLHRNGDLATRGITFVDDIHIVGRSSDLTMRACKRLKSKMNSAGNHAMVCKYCQPCTTPGAWNGLLIHMNTPFPMKTTT